MNEVELFLKALFEHLPPGHVEVRIIQDRKGGRLLGRRWYPSASAFLEVLPRMIEYADHARAGIFFGVLPRRAEKTGKAEDAIAGYAAWTDLDFRDFPGGESECTRRLNGFPFQPSTRVRSGHGLHAYWFFKEPQEPAVLVDLSARLALVLGGDNVADAARIMRLPGTKNHKDPDEPLPVVIESMDLDRRYLTLDLDDFLPELPDDLKPDGPASVAVGERMSERVEKLLESHPRLRNLFEGKGKPIRDEQGNRLDTTSSGYDYSLAYALALKGVTDEAELATALWRRPDDAARSKGMRYILRTVRRALGKAAEKKGRSSGRRQGGGGDESKIDFAVERVRIFDSNPRIHELTILGKPLSLSTPDLLSKQRFAIRFVETFCRVPELPSGGTAWRKQVNIWLAQAELVDLPPEAFDSEELRQEILIAVNSLSIGDDVNDLDQGKALIHGGGVIFKTRTIQKLLKDSFAEVKTAHVCWRLRELGFVSRTVRVDDEVVRAWTRDTTQAAEAGSAPEVNNE